MLLSICFKVRYKVCVTESIKTWSGAAQYLSNVYVYKNLHGETFFHATSSFNYINIHLGNRDKWRDIQTVGPCPCGSNINQ